MWNTQTAIKLGDQMKKYKKWTIIKKECSHGRKVFISDEGDIRVTYSKAPKWAQKAAMEIYRDGQEGFPTEKGIATIVRKFWARIIADAAKS